MLDPPSAADIPLRAESDAGLDAWLECRGHVLIGGEARERYRALESCSATAARIADSTAFAGSDSPVSHTH